MNASNRMITRRTLLKGLGTVTIGLPFLEEMLVCQAAAAAGEPAVPVRAFNVFFGLGIPAPLQEEGFEGVLEPLLPLRQKLLLLRQVDQLRCDQSGINAHYDGSAGAFTAEPPRAEARAGGPSLDQMIRHAAYPDGLPADMVPTLVAGTYFRRSDRLTRYVHSFNPDGTAAGAMQERPRDLFERVFGRVSLSQDPDARRERLKRSVLDSVMEQYRFYAGPHSPLGAASKTRLSEHLDRIRELEQRAYALKDRHPAGPSLPPPSRLIHGTEADPGGEGIDVTLEDLTTEWRLMADLYALAIQTDRVRFGSITFLSAGERIRLKGKYEFGGRTLFEFDDGGQRQRSGANGCSHEWWHEFQESRRNEALRAHAHMKMREVAYFLRKLDDVVEANGRSLLENSLITISTESGDGRHDNVKRELSGVFHAITGAGGRFKTGQTLDLGAEGLDLYNTLLEGMGVNRRMGPPERESRRLDLIRA